MAYKKNVGGEKFDKSNITSYLPTEDKIQQEIFMYLQNNYCTKINNPQCVVFAVPNQNQWKLTNIGVVAGVSDLIFLMPNRTIFIEVKTDTGVQSPAQKKFQEKVTALGFEYIIAKRVEDVLAYFENKNVKI